MFSFSGLKDGDRRMMHIFNHDLEVFTLIRNIVKVAVSYIT